MLAMQKQISSIFPRWPPAILVMLIIFLFSSQPSDDLPNFNSFDYLIKKAGHMTGYGLLAISYFYAFNRRDSKSFYFAWMLAVLYAFTDEVHQSFVPGRHSSIWDVLLFDNFGAILALYFISWRNKR
jgi:VanZ family protein